MNRRIRSGLSLKLLGRSRRLLALILALGALSSFVPVTLGLVERTSIGAIQDSLRADAGQRAFALQTGDPAKIAVLRSAPGLVGVRDELATVASSTRAARVLIRTSSDPSVELGVLTTGRRPAAHDEIMLSAFTADGLGVQIGEAIVVTLDSGPVTARLVGLSVDPADDRATTAVMVDPHSESFAATRWLGDGDASAVPAIRDLLDRRLVTYRPLASLLDAAEANPPPFLRALKRVPLGSAVLLVAMLVIGLGLIVRSLSPDVRALQMAGLAARQAWRTVYTPVLGAAFIGQLLGTLAALACLSVGRSTISGWLGQDWQTIVFPWPIGILLGVLMVLTAVSAHLISSKDPGRWKRTDAAIQVRRVPSLIGAGAVVAAALAGGAMWMNRADHQLGLWPGIVAAAFVVGVGLSVGPVIGRGFPLASRRFFGGLRHGLGAVSSVVGLVVLLTCSYALSTYMDAERSEALASPDQPRGSFLVSDAPDATVSMLLREYEARGGHSTFVSAIPEESKSQLRVTSVGLANCAKSQPTSPPNDLDPSCWPQRARSPINAVHLGPAGSPSMADPSLINSGMVGLLRFDSGSEVPAAQDESSATPAPILGGFMPGLVVASDSAVALTYHLTPSGSSQVALLDFHRLTPESQYEMRSLVSRLAPGGQVADGTTPTQFDRMRGTANLVSLAGAGLALLTLITGAAVVLGAGAESRRLLHDLGPARRIRARLAASWAAVPFLTCVAGAGGAVFATAAMSGSALAGWIWSLPAVVGLAAALALAGLVLSPPQETRD